MLGCKYAKTDSDVNALKWVCKHCDQSLPTLREMNKNLATLKFSNNARFDAIEEQVRNVKSSIKENVVCEGES